MLGPAPVLRTRRDGDRFQPSRHGRPQQALAELFTNAKVPAAARDRWPLLLTGAGDIAWVCGLRIDERARITAATQQVLHISLRRTRKQQGNEGKKAPSAIRCLAFVVVFFPTMKPLTHWAIHHQQKIRIAGRDQSEIWGALAGPDGSVRAFRYDAADTSASPSATTNTHRVLQLDAYGFEQPFPIPTFPSPR